MRDLIHVGVLHESIIFARGLTITLQQEDPILRVQALSPEDGLDADLNSFDRALDVLVCSESRVPSTEVDTRIVLLTNAERTPIELGSRTDIVAALHPAGLAPTVLADTVRAAGCGIPLARAARDDSFSARGLQVLAALSSGDTTRDISRRLGFSERTIKQEIADLQRALGARNRCQMVANALRSGLI